MRRYSMSPKFDETFDDYRSRSLHALHSAHKGKIPLQVGNHFSSLVAIPDSHVTPAIL